MNARLFTFVCEFRGTTYVSQVWAPDESHAVQVWTDTLRKERPFARASAYLAKSFAAKLGEYPPVAIGGISNVWCITGSCGGKLMLADIIETVSPGCD